MGQPERNNLIDEMLRKTEQGRVQDWNERLAEIARRSNIDLARIGWSKPPRHVAIDIADAARATGRDQDLLKAVHETP